MGFPISGSYSTPDVLNESLEWSKYNLKQIIILKKRKEKYCWAHTSVQFQKAKTKRETMRVSKQSTTLYPRTRLPSENLGPAKMGFWQKLSLKQFILSVKLNEKHNEAPLRWTQGKSSLCQPHQAEGTIHFICVIYRQQHCRECK